MSTVPFLDLTAGVAELRGAIDAAMARVLDSGTYIGGEEVEAFERAFARYVGAEECVAVGNGMDALAIALHALDIGPGSEILVPSHTFAATWMAVSRVGATPVPVEPDAQTMNIDPGGLKAAVTPKTRAIMPVHLYGQPADLDGIREVAGEHGLPVVEDAAQAHGARWRGRRIGAAPSLAAWSFYPSKCLGALGDAGAITLNDSGLAGTMRAIRNYGSVTKHRHEREGLNSRMDPLQAAVLLAKLEVLDDWNARRGRVARQYLDRIRARDLGLIMPMVRPEADPSWHLFVVRAVERDRLGEHLAERGIQTGRHYPVPPHMQPAFADLGWGRGSLPISERLAEQAISLPIGPHLLPDQIDRVVDAVNSFVPRAACR